MLPYHPLKAFYNSHRPLCRGLAAACAGVILLRWLAQRRERRKALEKRKGYPRDTVILHQFGRGPYAPSMTPYAVKLETYLRMAKIPYQNEHSFEPSSKQKYPWITYNGEDIADSAFCIQFLNKTRKVDLNAWMTTEQRAIAVAFQRLVEDDLYWALLVIRWVNEVDYDFLTISFPMVRLMPLYTKRVMTPRFRKQAWAQGMGRHSQEEIRQIIRKDLTALTTFLGRKKFLMGDQPCEEDCTVFGMLSQVTWQLPSSISTMFKEEFPQLVEYCERMKDTFWSDWQHCTTQGGTVAATR